jgi:hypothetical protein
MLAYIFVIFAVAVRFMPHPWAFTPLAASLLFFGSRGSRRQMWVPLLLLAVTDVILTRFVYAYAFTVEHLASWVFYAAVLWLGTRLGRNPRPVPVIGAALASSVSFFLISNFSSWASWTDMYPRTLSGLMAAYAAGLPFFRRSVEGDLLFTAAMFATPALLRAFSGAWNRTAGDHIRPV